MEEKGERDTTKDVRGLEQQIKDLEILAREPIAVTFICEDGHIRFASMMNQKLHRQIEEATSPEEETATQEAQENFARAKEKNFGHYIG